MSNSQTTSDLMQKLSVPHNRINIHKPDFLNWQSAFLLAKEYLKDLTKEELVMHNSICRCEYDITYEPNKTTEVTITKKLNKQSVTVIIDVLGNEEDL